MFFFRGGRYLAYDARTDTVDATRYPADTGPAWPGLAGVAAGPDAVLNWGDGSVGFFAGDVVVRYDVRADRVLGSPTTIAAALPALAAAGFDRDLSAAVHYRPGKALFFRGARYLRLDIATGSVEPGYPKPISAGWTGIDTAGFGGGIDAAVNFGEGKAYFFRGSEYVRVDIAANAVDPGYPLGTAAEWPALPVSFTSGISDVIEWPYVDAALLDAQVTPTCVVTPGPFTIPPSPNRVHQLFAVVARFDSSAYPADCRCGEYRQYVRGAYTVDGRPHAQFMAGPGGPVQVLPRPAPGTASDNFREDALIRSTALSNLHYGHRDEEPGNLDTSDLYLPDRRTGCEYRGFDVPFLEGRPGQAYTMDLDFRGVLIDVCNGGVEMARKEWRVFCSGSF